MRNSGAGSRSAENDALRRDASRDRAIDKELYRFGLSAALVFVPASALAQDLSQESGSTIDVQPGEFVARPSDSVGNPRADERREDTFSATYVGADARVVVNEILGDYLGLDYSIAPEINGQVTMRIDGVNSRNAALDALRSSLQPLNVSVVEQGDFVAVMTSRGEGGPSQPSVMAPGDPSPPGGGVVVMTPRYIAPTRLAELLVPFASASAVALSDDTRRFIILRGDEATISAASAAAAMFDVDWFSQVSTGSFQLNHITPRDLIAELKPILGPAAATVEFVPMERMSRLVVLSRSPQTLDVIHGWVAQLDVPSAQLSAGLLIYEARHLSAEELAESVRELGGAATSYPPSANTALSTPSQSVDGLAETTASDFPSAPPPAPGAFSVTTNASRNMVIVRGDADQLSDAERLLRALDEAKTQVMIEAAIIEVTLNDELQFGVNWSGIEDRLTATFSDVPSGQVTSAFPGAALTYVNTDIEAAINLLASVTEIEVVSRPSVIALNNEIANLQVGDQVPIVTQSAVSVIDPAAPIVNQTEYRDTGIILNVTPRVRGGGLVELEVEQEASQVARTTSSGIDSPTIQQRKIASKLLVPTGQSVALGGLISTARTSTATGVPLLMDVPLFGQLFRSNADFVERTELIVFLTPRVLYDPQDAVAETDRMRAAFAKLEAELAPS